MQLVWTATFLACLAHFTMAEETAQEPPLATEAPEPLLDLKAAAPDLVNDVRVLTAKAKSSMLLEDLLRATVDIRSNASALIIASNGQGPVPECEINLVIKLAAAAIGPHELLTGLLAKSLVQVHNARMAMGIALLENTAQILEDESARSDDVRPQVAAIVFAAEALEDIIRSAEADVTTFERVKAGQDGEGRAAREDQVVPLGDGFTATPLGPAWGSSTGSVGWTLERSVRSPLSETFAKRQWSGSLGGFYNGGGNWGVSAGLTFKF